MLTDRSPVSHFVVVDTPTMSEKRIGDVAGLNGAKTRTLVIDHHVSDDDEGDVQVIDSGASAASELVYLLIRADGASVTEEMATCLYAGIAFDTKLFKYSHPKRALAAAAELAEYGVDPQEIAEELFTHQTYETVKTLGIALANMTLHKEGQICALYVDHATYTMGGDLDVVVDHAMSIDGVEVALFFKEESPGRQRVSLRSRGKVDVNRAARQFDGGGHMRASGCTIEGTVNEAHEQVLAAVSEQL
jgi:phosphoesterase RecJ-like protein